MNLFLFWVVYTHFHKVRVRKTMTLANSLTYYAQVTKSQTHSPLQPGCTNDTRERSCSNDTWKVWDIQMREKHLIGFGIVLIINFLLCPLSFL